MSRRLLESLTVHDSDSNSSDDDSPKKAPLEKVHCPSQVCSNMLTSNSSPTKTSTIPTAYRSPVTVLRDITNMKVLDSKENSDDDTSSSNIAVIPFIEQPLPDYYDMSTEDLSVMQTIDNLSITEPMVDYSTNNTDTGIKEIDNDNEEKIIAYEADIIGDIIEKGQNKLTGVTCHMPNNIVIDANESNRIQLTSDRVGYVGRDIEVKHNYESCELLTYQTPPSTSNCRSTPFYTSPLPVSSTKSLTNASNRRKRGSSIMFLISPKDLSSTEIASLSNLNEEDMPNRDNDVDCKLFSGKVDEFTPRFSVCHVSDFRRSKYHTDVNRCHNPAASASIPFPPSIRGSNGRMKKRQRALLPFYFGVIRLMTSNKPKRRDTVVKMTVMMFAFDFICPYHQLRHRLSPVYK